MSIETEKRWHQLQHTKTTSFSRHFDFAMVYKWRDKHQHVREPNLLNFTFVFLYTSFKCRSLFVKVSPLGKQTGSHKFLTLCINGGTLGEMHPNTLNIVILSFYLYWQGPEHMSYQCKLISGAHQSSLSRVLFIARKDFRQSNEGRCFGHTTLGFSSLMIISHGPFRLLYNFLVLFIYFFFSILFIFWQCNWCHLLL